MHLSSLHQTARPSSFIARCDGWLGVKGSAAEQDLYRDSGRSYTSHLFSHVRQLLYVGIFGIRASGTTLVSYQRIRGTRSGLQKVGGSLH